MVRNFNLINELGQTYSLMDIQNYCLLTEPEGLGCSFETEYRRIGNSFINNAINIEQTQIGGTLNFSSYDNYASFVNFVISSKELKLQYKIPKKDNISIYYKDVIFKSITKSEKKETSIISESLILEATSLWYEENAIIYSVGEDTSDEIRWDFEWDSIFADYENRTIVFENNSHTESPFLLRIDGYVNKPKITIYDNENNVVDELEVNVTVNEHEAFEISTKDTDLFINKIKSNGDIINLFNNLDLNNRNFFKIPKGLSTIKLSSTDSEILSAKLVIYKQYISV